MTNAMMIPRTMNYTDELIKSDDRIYYNIDVREGRLAPTGLPYAEFSIERSHAILDNPKDYYLTIARFTVPVLDAPIFIMPIQIGQPNINLTTFSVTLTYGGTDFQEWIIYITQTPTIPPPTVAGFVDVYQPYYYSVYTYNDFLAMINTAFQTAFTALKVAFPLAPQTEAPYYIYDAPTQLFSLITPYDYIPANGLDVYINAELLTYIGNIHGTFFNRTAVAGKVFRYVIQNIDNGYAKPGGIIPVPPLVPDYLKFQQEYIGLDLMNSFFDIVFTTGTLNIVREWTQTSDPLNQTPNSISLLTDFQPQLSRAGDSRSTMVYFPTGPYRIINLTGNTPLRNFDFKVWWKDKQGRLYPLTIPYNQVLSIKFLFIKKSTFTS